VSLLEGRRRRFVLSRELVVAWEGGLLLDRIESLFIIDDSVEFGRGPGIYQPRMVEVCRRDVLVEARTCGSTSSLLSFIAFSRPNWDYWH
jgi:hypothetical protein